MNSRRTALLLLLAVTSAGCIQVEDDEEPLDRAPVARITLEAASGPAPFTVRVSGESSTASRGAIASHAWTFGDGGTASGARAEHNYASVGDYLITLTVTDEKGRSGTATTRVVATGPLAVYDASAFDAAEYQDEPSSGTYDTATLE